MTDEVHSGHHKLLVVDDSRLILQMVGDFFRGAGYAVEVAGSGEEALEYLDEQVPDVIVADILMPGMDGWELLETVRSRPDAADVPFLFLTTESELPKRVRGFRAGADDYVTKPFEVEELHARVERSLARRHAVESARRGGGAHLSGSVEHMGLPDLLQILSINGKSGCVYIESGSDRGAVHFRNGCILHAESGAVRGSKALYRMMAWDLARFRFVPDTPPPERASVEGDTSNLLMSALVSLDEWNRWRTNLPDPLSVLELTLNAWNLIDPAHVDGPMFDVLARSKQGHAVGAILEDSSYPDGDLARAICRLIERGVLRPKGPTA